MKFKDEFVYAEMLHKNETKKVKEDLKSMSEQIKVLSKEMTDKDDACRKEIDQIKETIQLLKETDIPYENSFLDIRKEKEEHDISFSARLGTSIADINPWDTVVFDQVISNNGNSYNAATGIFTAPIAGSYHFSSTIMTLHGSITEISLKVNKENSMWMYPCASTEKVFR
ncbi:heavy metal-binding protein HIP-like [Mytilus californianus]|uniref:heavy metal-binding protein HIP-like n=1 Tax=Mytilus californianus TaxID=6549 RepID=UPI0022472F07|nr:heavy metal-binding protein HIP-like [Mytilus californianus]